MKTLIIRTDKLGDFYQTIPYINCLTRIYGKTNVDIVVKKHIYHHIKKKKYLYNNLYSFEENGIFNKVFLILKLRKNNYKQIIIFDGKDRSIILSKFLNVDKINKDSSKYKTFIDNEKSKMNIQRFKGLGEMNPEELWSTTLNPETRTLLKVEYSKQTKVKSKDDQKLIQTLMGNDVAPRKDFIISRALDVSNLDI